VQEKDCLFRYAEGRKERVVVATLFINVLLMAG
jgi:hypothetical protein